LLALERDTKPLPGRIFLSESMSAFPEYPLKQPLFR